MATGPMQYEQSEPFGWAITMLRQGKRVARSGWNGKGMYLFLRGSINNDEPVIVMFTAQGKTQPGWLASQADMLAVDWHLVEG